jgi:hypothetical protein
VIGGHNGKLFRSTDRGDSWAECGDAGFGTNKVLGIAYGGGVFVAGETGGKMARSGNYGASWVEVVNSTFGISQINRIRYLNGKFYAVGYSDRMAYSANGVNWTAVNDILNTSNGIWDIAYGSGKYIVTGRGDLMRYSENGIDGWQKADGLGIFSSNIVTITYADGKFVAGNNSANGNLGYSADGDSGWVKGGSFGYDNVYDIAWGAGTFMSVTRTKIAYSADGVSWEFPGWQVDGNSVGGTGIAYGDGRFVIVSNGRVFVIGD